MTVGSMGEKLVGFVGKAREVTRINLAEKNFPCAILHGEPSCTVQCILPKGHPSFFILDKILAVPLVL